MSATVYDFSAVTIDGAKVELSQYRGKVLLIVNTASQCGYTPQYAGLEKLYQQYRDRGLVILGFPCNQFGKQEPGSSADIASFCKSSYRTSFPLFAKIDVNGAQAHPLFNFLKQQAPGFLGTQFIKWNFTKFLVDRRGKVIRRFGTRTVPQAIVKDIEALLSY